MTDYPAPAPPYLGPARRTSAGSNRPIRRVVIHSTVSATTTGGARSIAAYFRSAAAGGSAHYVIDPAEVVQVVYDGTIAWHAPPNAHTIGLELCEVPTWDLKRVFGKALPRGVREEGDEDVREDLDPGPEVKRVNVWRWILPAHRAMYDRAARLTAEILLHEGLPARWVTATDMRRDPNVEGVTSHRQTSLAFGQSSHWDPGAWPRRAFMRRVRKYVREIRLEAANARA